MSKIMKIRSREILDSRDNPTVEADVLTNGGLSRASVPSSARETETLRCNCRKLVRRSFSFCKSPKSTWSSIWGLFLRPKSKGALSIRVSYSDTKKV
jgi:hypothetical protein